MAATILVRVNSHRARHKLRQALGGLPQGYFSWDREGEFYRIADDQGAAALAITGISKARDGDDLCRYLDMSGLTRP